MRDHNPKPRITSGKETPLTPGDRREETDQVIEEANGQPHARAPVTAWNARLASRLKEAANGCNFHEIARRTDANAETVRRYFRDGNPSVSFVSRFCKVFHVSADWLLNGKHWSARQRAGHRPPSPIAKLRLTLALSKGRVRVLNQAQARAGSHAPRLNGHA